MARRKIGVVGAGNVGASAALLIQQRGIGDVILSDIVEGMPQGKALDLTELGPVEGLDSLVRGTTAIEEMKDCEVVVLTAGVPRKPGMTREQLLDINAKIVRDVCDRLLKVNANPILIVVTNPLDVMTYLAWKATGWDRRRVLGMAGVLDSSRMAWFVAEKLGVSMRDVRAMVLGSHGDTMVALPRFTTVSGVPITELMSAADVEAISKRTRDGGIEIVNLLKTGSAFYAPGASCAAMVESIVRDEKRLLPCSVALQGEYGLKDTIVGVPVILGAAGAERIVELKLSPEELAAVHKSAKVVRDNLDVLKL